MPLSDIATINVTTTGAGVTRAGYGVPAILSYTAAGPDRTTTYSSIGSVADDFAVNTPEYRAANKVFGQSPKISRIVIGRGTLPPTQRFSVGVQAVALNTDFSVRIAGATGVAWVSQDATYNPGAGATGWVASNTWSMGDLIVGGTGSLRLYSCLGQSSAAGYGLGSLTGIGSTMGPSGIGAAIPEGQIWWMFLASGATGEVAVDAVPVGLMGKSIALNSHPIMGTGLGQLMPSIQGSQGSRTLRYLANASNKFFGLQVYSRAALTIAQDHADPGVATDLAAVAAESKAWYALVTLFNSEDYVNAAAAWVESNTKLYAAASLDSAIARTAESVSATDVAHDIKAAAYARTWAFFHPSNDEHADAAEFGKFLSYSPGSETWRMKTLAGVTVENYTDTEITNMKAKYAHFYYDIGGRNVVGGDAKTGSGEYVDVTRGLDWYTSELQAKLANTAIANGKIPFTNAGIDMIEARITEQNLAGVAAGLISPDEDIIIETPDVTDISDEDKADRELSSVVTTWTLAGAIHHITVSVTASV